jgi:outer membrane protein assembly factor BamB
MKRLVWFLLALSPRLLLAVNLYTMEGGSPDRHNAGLYPSSITAPLHACWISQACFGVPADGPIVLTDRIVQNFESGLQCVDRNDGHALWHLNNGDSGVFHNSPAFDPKRGLLYQCTSLGATFAVDPSSGNVTWFYNPGFRPGSDQFSAPLFVNDLLYVGKGGSGFVCLNPDTRAVQWHFDFAQTDNTCTPAWEPGRIYLPTGSGKIYCLNDTTGALIWSVDSHKGEHSGILLNGNYIYTMLNIGQVQCRSKTDGHLIWTYQTDSWAEANLATCGQLLIATSDDRSVHALNLQTGDLCWKRHFDGNFARSPAFVICDLIFVSGCVGHYYGIDGKTGNTVWDYDNKSFDSFVDWAEADGHLYTADLAGHIYCFSPDVPGDPAHCACDLLAWTMTPTPVLSPTPSASPTVTPTSSPTATPTRSPTASPTTSPTNTPTATPSATPTASPTETSTPSSTPTPSPSSTPTASPTFTPSASPSTTPTQTPALTATSEAATQTAIAVLPAATQTVIAQATATATALQPTYTAAAQATQTAISYLPVATQTAVAQATATMVAAQATATFVVQSTQTAIGGLPPATQTAVAQVTKTAITQANLPDPKVDEAYVYPQPARNGDPAHVTYHMEESGKATIHLFRSNGEEALKDSKQHGYSGIGNMDVDTRPLAPGIYFYLIDKDYDSGRHTHTKVEKLLVIK